MQSRCVIKCKGIAEQRGFKLPWKHETLNALWAPRGTDFKSQPWSLKESPKDQWAGLGRVVGIMIGDEATVFQLSRMSKRVGFHGGKNNEWLFKQTWKDKVES